MHHRTQACLARLAVDLGPAQELARRIMSAQYAKNTVLTYRYSWNLFVGWCGKTGHASLPATTESCLEYAAWSIANGYRLDTVYVRLKSINHYHRQHRLAPPCDRSLSEFMRNARRALCEEPHGKQALTPLHLARITEQMRRPHKTIDIRDRAILLLCFAAGWRRSEIVSLDTKNVRWVADGVTLRLGKSKTDQAGVGRTVGIQRGENPLTCPIGALNEWIAARGTWPGPLFVALDGRRCITNDRLTPDGVRRAVKRGLKLIGEETDAYGAHSLRAGMITAAAEAGATETAIMQRTGHRSYEMIRRYIRPAEVFRSNPLKGVL